MVLKPNAVVDIAKPGPQLQNLTGMWNARVLDGFTPFVVQFKENGLPVNLTGLNAFIEGDIGEGHYDSATDDIVMTGTPKSVRYTDDGSGNTNMGIVVFRLPPQFFIQTGIFKGFIGLQSSSGIRSTSNDVWFKVLGSSYTMGISCKYFISDFQKALDQANDKIDQALADLYNKYNQKAGQAEGGLDKVLAAIDEIKSAQQNLNTQIDGVRTQINNNDIITRREFNDLGNRLNQQVSNLRQNKTLYFKDIAELQTQYPSGTDNLCITLNDKHLHVYDYVNSIWVDAGATNIVSTDPQTKDALYQDSSNVAPDPDFKIVDGEWSAGSDIGTPNWAFEAKTLDNSKVVRLDGYYNQATENNWNNSWWVSRNINITGQKTISLGWLVNAKSSGQPLDAHSQMEITFMDAAGNKLEKLTNQIPESQDDNLRLVKWENITGWPAEATDITFSILIHGTGTVRFCKPILNFDSEILPYDNRQINKLICQKVNSDNILIDPDFNNVDYNWHPGSDNNNFKLEKLDKKINNSSIVRLTNTDANKNVWLTSKTVQIPENNTISFSALLSIHLDDPANAQVALSFTFFDGNKNRIGGPSDNRSFCQPTSLNTNLTQYTFNGYTVPANAKYLNAYIFMAGKGYVDIARPQVNGGNSALPYSVKDEVAYIQSIAYTPNIYNLVPNATLDNLDLWHWGADQGEAKVELLDKKFNNSNVVRIYGRKSVDNNDPGNVWFTSKNFDIKGAKTLSISWMINYVQNNISDGTVCIAIEFDDDHGKITDSRRYVTKTLSKDLKQLNLYNIEIPDGATQANTYVMIHHEGYVDVAYPQVSFSSNKIKKIKTDDFDSYYSLGKDLGGLPDSSINDDGTFVIHGFHSDQTQNNWNNSWITSANMDIKSENKFISLDFLFDAKFEQENNDNYIRLELHILDKSSKELEGNTKVIYPAQIKSGMSHYYWDGCPIPDDAAYFYISLVIHNKATVTVKSISHQFDKVYQETKLPKVIINNQESIEDAKWHNAKFYYFNDKTVISGYLQIGIQGDSSRNYPKKNYKIKLFEDKDNKKKLKLKPKSNWTANNKFNLKANYIDVTQSRNLVNAQLIESAVKNIPLEKYDESGEILKAQGLGQMEGFPVEVYLSDGYHGLYTFNTKKDEKTLAMDSSNTKHEAISIELDKQVFRDPKATIDEKLYNTEIHDTPSATTKANFEKFVQFINNASVDDFTNQLKNYIDVKSCMTTMLFGMMSKEYDYYSKSYLLCTWNDGAYWYMVPYDLDSTWGLYWNGSQINEDGNDQMFDFESLQKNPNVDSFITNHGQNRLFERIYEHMQPELISQYKYLRSTVWKNSDIVDSFKKYINSIPELAYKKDLERWPDIPSKDITDFEQIQRFAIKRANTMDNYFDIISLSNTKKGSDQ